VGNSLIRDVFLIEIMGQVVEQSSIALIQQSGQIVGEI